MNEQLYPFKLIPREFRYEFVSASEEKEVRKVVLISPTKKSELFHLALLDVQDDGTLRDDTVTNNGDIKSVVATIYHIIRDFTNKFPNAVLVFKGGDQRRQRLYRIVLRKELSNLSEEWVVFGGVNMRAELFQPDTDYEIYFITRK